MGTIVISEFLSVDGVSDDPAGVEGFERGGWTFALDSAGQRVRLRGDEGEELLLAENRDAAALLMGRRTYEFFASFWPRQEGRALADIINTMPKYVVSSTLEDAEWNNSRVLSGALTEEVGRLKREIEGENRLEPGHASTRYEDSHPILLRGDVDAALHATRARIARAARPEGSSAPAASLGPRSDRPQVMPPALTGVSNRLVGQDDDAVSNHPGAYEL